MEDQDVFANPREVKNLAKVRKVMERLTNSLIQPVAMPKLTTHEIVTIDPQECESLIASNIYEYQRDLNINRVAEYAAKMVDGRFHSATIGIAYYQGMMMMVNGQHTTYAAIAANRSITVTKMVWHCETEEELACLWSQWDTGGSRTLGQMAACYVPVFGEGYNAKSVAYLAAACSLATGGLKAIRDTRFHLVLTKEEKIKLISRYPTEAELARRVVFGYDGDNPVEHLLRTCVGGSIVATAEKDGEAAATFWQKVRTGIGVEDDEDPAYVLREHLMKTSYSPTNGSGKGKSHEPPETTTAKCVMMWNAFRRGRPVKMGRISYSGQGIPTVE